MNSSPCAQPTNFTASGMPAAYFSGMAMKRSMRNEAPSSRPTARSRPIGVFNMAKGPLLPRLRCRHKPRPGGAERNPGEILKLPFLWLLALQSPLPWPATLQLHREREAQERSDEHDEPQHRDALQCRFLAH